MQSFQKTVEAKNPVENAVREKICEELEEHLVVFASDFSVFKRVRYLVLRYKRFQVECKTNVARILGHYSES